MSLAVLGGLSPALQAAPVATSGGPYGFCPKGEPLVNSQTHWQEHRLAPGVSLAETTVHDNRGAVAIHVVRADLTHKGIRVEPLRRSLDAEHSLMSLAAHRRLVAATNGMYFDYPDGPPVVPFVSVGSAPVLTIRHQPVAGVGSDDRLEAGDVWLEGDVRDAHGERRLVAVNEVDPPHGLTLYTPGWGRRPVPLGPAARSLVVREGRAVARASTGTEVQPHRHIIVANGASAVRWLETIRAREEVSISRKVATNAPRSFIEAFGTGTQVVKRAGRVRTGLYCRTTALFVPRTTIGWADDGKQLILVVVSVRGGTDQHGLDENQMSYLLVELGASKAFALDGGGSSEMVARLRSTHALSIRGEAPRSYQRPMPVGVGVYAPPPG